MAVRRIRQRANDDWVADPWEARFVAESIWSEGEKDKNKRGTAELTPPTPMAAACLQCNSLPSNISWEMLVWEQLEGSPPSIATLLRGRQVALILDFEGRQGSRNSWV